MVASAANIEQAGNTQYQSKHMNEIFKAGMSFSGFERDGLFLSLGAGGKFREISGASGIDSITDGRGAIFADFDNDGDLDIAVTTIQKTSRLLYRNNVGQDTAFIRVTLQGTKSGRDAFGAVVRVKTALGTQTKIKAGGSGFVSESDPRLLFGLGAQPAIGWLEVTWPSGQRQRLDGIRPGQSLKIIEGAAGFEVIEERRFNLIDPENAGAGALRSLAVAKGAKLPEVPILELSGAATDLVKIPKPGRRTLVNFWATWCAPCRQEMRDLSALAPRLASSGVDLIGVSLDFDDVLKVRAFLGGDAQRVRYPIYVAKEGALSALAKGDDLGVPFTILLDSEGRLLDAFSGWSARTRRALEALAAGN